MNKTVAVNSIFSDPQGLTVSYLSPTDIKPYPNNPKKHSERQVHHKLN